MLQGQEQGIHLRHFSNWVNKYSLMQGYLNQLGFNHAHPAMHHKLVSLDSVTYQRAVLQLPLDSKEAGLLALEKVQKLVHLLTGGLNLQLMQL
jgi:hypothetical protein